MALLERLQAPGPKRMLALDGGGIRGAITLGFLERIESILRERHGQPPLRLCDYFDLIGGTSTGAIIAGALAIGMTAEEIKEMYLTLGGKVFGRKKWKKWEALFSAEPLKAELEGVFKNRSLGDASIETGLCVVAKRADTRSTWPLINHPRARYYEKNKDIPLREAIRASTAAPVYFVPEKFDVGAGEIGAFVDGGVSMANNPALQLFLIATLKGFPFHWKPGENELLLVSVGTGVWSQRDPWEKVVEGKVWDWASQVPSMLMDDASWQNQLLLQCLSRSKTPWEIDREVGTGTLLTSAPLLTYMRYNARLEADALRELGLDNLAPKAAKLREMSDAGNRFDLAEIGTKAAARQVAADHFPETFDLPA